jgi:hypothetical protein
MANQWPSDTDPLPVDKLDQDTDAVTGTGNAREQLLAISNMLNQILGAAAPNSDIVTTTDRFNSALTNVANIFTQIQQVKMSTPRIQLNDTGGDMAASYDFLFNDNTYARMRRITGGNSWLELSCADESNGLVNSTHIRMKRNGQIELMSDSNSHVYVFDGGALTIDGVAVAMSDNVATLIDTGRAVGSGASFGSVSANTWMQVASIAGVTISPGQTLTVRADVNAMYDSGTSWWQGIRFLHNGATFGTITGLDGPHLFAESVRTTTGSGALTMEIQSGVSGAAHYGSALLTYRIER